MNDDARRVSETLGTGQEVFAHWGGRVKDVHANCRDKIERLQQVADDLANHLRGYVCHCQMSKCKCGYDDVMDAYEAVRGEE